MFFGGLLAASWGRLGTLWGRAWGRLGSRNGRKFEKKSMQKSIKKLMHLGIDFWEDLGGFREAKWSHVGTQREPKTDLMLKALKIKKIKTNGFLMILGVRGVQVGSKNRSKIDHGVSREVWGGCRRFWRGSSGEVLGGPAAPRVGGGAG